MKFAIIAAGEGSRLASEGIAVPKPLVKVGGECLLDRLIRVFLDNDATEIVVVCHAGMPQVAAHLDTLRREGLHQLLVLAREHDGRLDDDNLRR